MAVKLKFKCSHCGNETIEEVMTNVNVYSLVSDIDSDGNLDYTEFPQLEDGELQKFQCFKCGRKIANTVEELVKFLMEESTKTK